MDSMEVTLENRWNHKAVIQYLAELNQKTIKEEKIDIRC